MAGVMNSLTDVTVMQAILLSRQQETYQANDLANYDTPNYKSRQLNFQTQLAQAMQGGVSAVKQVTGTVATVTGSQQPNGNSVSLTNTMAQLTKTQLLFETAVEALNAKAGELQTISEGQVSS
ncbi:MAG: flagellar basal body rod protein [Firmicutes bacterium]|nr:flagellar basal body rod protein [Bacillota bacterium]